MRTWETKTAEGIMNKIIKIEERMTAINLNGLINHPEYESLKKDVDYLYSTFDDYCRTH